MPIFEFECPECKERQEMLTANEWETKRVRAGRLSPLCERCQCATKMVPPLAAFKINGNYRADNGYSLVKGDK